MIKEFQGEYRWLSNFYPCSIILGGRDYPSVEHAYMSAKSDEEDWKIFCASTKSPGEVKRASRNIKLRADWDKIKIQVMKECLQQKYYEEPFYSKLRNTKDEYIQEGNNWGDTFWGVDLRTGKGQNTLGKLIMEIRDDII